MKRAQAEQDLRIGGSVYEIKKAPCQSTVYADGHFAGTVSGCAKHTRFAQTTVDEPECLLSLAPKKSGGAYTLTVKKSGY
jgi:hypothetical protein